MSINLVIFALSALTFLQAKHLLIDWIWQPRYEWKNKHEYLHPGGLRHAFKNALGTGIAIWAGFWGSLSIPVVLGLIVADFVVHYHVDWAKMNLNKALGYGPLTHAEFWWLTGFDQFLHQITYLLLVAVALMACLPG